MAKENVLSNWMNKCLNEIKIHKKVLVIIIFVVIIIVVFVYVMMASNDNGIEIKGPNDDKITIIYGDEIPKSQFSIKRKNRDPIDVTKGSFSEYDKELIGTQSVKFSYEGVDKEFTLIINKKPLGSVFLELENNQIRWSEIQEAKEYKIYVDDVIIATTTDNFFIFEEKSMLAGKFIIQVEAIGINEKYENSMSKEETMVKLGTPSGIDYKDGKIVWNPVTESKEVWYEVWVNETPYKQTKINENEIEFSLVEGENKIEIRAKSADSNVVWSDVAEVTFRKLSKVTNIRCNKNGILWDSTDENCKYVVKIDGKEQDEKPLISFYDYELEKGKTYTVSVKVEPNGQENTFASEESVPISVQYRKLDKPKIGVKKGNSDLNYIVELSAVENATNYKIQVIQYIGEESTTSSYLVEELKQEFTIDNQVTEIVIEVIAIDKTGAYAESDIAVENEKVEHGKLDQPKVTVSKGNYKNSYIVEYTKVENANQYEVEVIYITKKGSDSEKRIIEGTKREFEVTDDVISLEVRVTAINESGIHENSDTTVVTKEVK